MGEKQEEIKRFTAKKKADIVMDIFQGKTTVAEVSRKYDLTPALIEEWMEEAWRTSRAPDPKMLKSSMNKN